MQCEGAIAYLGAELGRYVRPFLGGMSGLLAASSDSASAGFVGRTGKLLVVASCVAGFGPQVGILHLSIGIMIF